VHSSAFVFVLATTLTTGLSLARQDASERSQREALDLVHSPVLPPAPPRFLASTGSSGTLYDNGATDGAGAYSNATAGTFGARRALLDDFAVPAASWILDGLVWTHVWSGGQTPPFGTGFELSFRDDAAGTPGSVVSTAVATGYAEVATGNVFFSRPEAASQAKFTPIALATGHYWLEAITVGASEDLWLVRSSVQGSECWLDYDDLGGLQPGSAQHGVPADLNFELSGTAETSGTCTLYDNGDPDGSNGLSNATAGVFGARRALVDDFVIPPSQSWDVDSLSWSHVWVGGQTPPFGTSAEVLLRTDAGGAPGPVSAVATNVAYTEIATGEVYFSRPEAFSTATFDPWTLTSGTHWLEGLVVGNDNDYWLVKEDVVGAECWLNYDDFGGLRPASSVFGQTVDLSFKLGGVTTTIGTKYCTPLPNSTGVEGEITARGSLLVVDNNVQLASCNLPKDQFGYYLNGLVAANVPTGNGILCIGGAIGRFRKQVASTGTAGLIVTQIDLTAIPRPTGGPHMVQQGETWLFTLWYRDGNTSNFTAGLSLTFQ